MRQSIAGMMLFGGIYLAIRMEATPGLHLFLAIASGLLIGLAVHQIIVCATVRALETLAHGLVAADVKRREEGRS